MARSRNGHLCHDNLEESLRFSIYFAIQQHRLAPPKTHDRTVRDALYSKVADAVMKQIKQSGWTITPLRMENIRQRIIIGLEGTSSVADPAAMAKTD